MTPDEFMQSYDLQIKKLVDNYAEQFGEQPPDLDSVSFWGSKIDALQEAIDTGVPIQLVEIADDADL